MGGKGVSDENIALTAMKEEIDSYGSTTRDDLKKSVRFQVVVWYVGPIDVVLGLVTMKFRVTIFWDAPNPAEHQKMALSGYGNYDASNKKVWTMEGRQRAFQKELNEVLPGSNLVYVPPISIINAVDFDEVGRSEVCCVNEEKRQYKWTCMYKASLIQPHMKVKSFPHDKHDLVLKLGIMKHRQKDRRWDMKKWRLGLAEEGDSQKTIRVPHGLIVDHVEVPGFSFEKEKNPIFEIVPLLYGPDAVDGTAVDECLQIRLQVRRDSGYYDNNIIPLLTMLNFAAIATLVLDPLEFGNRGEILLAIAFVSVGIRMSADTKLPGVSYQIKLQLILNKFCYTLLFLHIESALVYYLADRCGWEIEQTEIINNCTMICATIYTVALLFSYYIHDGRILKLL